MCRTGKAQGKGDPRCCLFQTSQSSAGMACLLSKGPFLFRESQGSGPRSEAFMLLNLCFGLFHPPHPFSSGASIYFLHLWF